MIEKHIDKVISELSPASGDNLMGMGIDITHFFGSVKEFDLVSSKQTEDLSCLFSIKLSASNNAHSLGELVRELKETYSQIAYSYLNISAVIRYKKSTVLRFVTVNEFGPYYNNWKSRNIRLIV